MTHVFTDDGKMHPATMIKTGACYVTNVLTKERDGYDAVQMGFDTKNETQAVRGQYKGVGNLKEGKGFRFVKEVAFKKTAAVKKGDLIDLNTFEAGDDVTVVGWSKGRGFAGVVKRHGFRGHPSTHGHKDQLRMPGSIGAGGVQRVFKGMRMGGHMGDAQITVKGAEVLRVDAEAQILYLKGGIPGARNSYVILKAEGDLKVASQEELPTTPVMEETPVVAEETVAPEEVAATPTDTEIAAAEPAVESVAEEAAKEETTA